MSSIFDPLLADWQFIRGQSRTFVEELGEGALELKLPRPGLDTPSKHFQEMIDVQRCYIEALSSGEMKFDFVKENDDYTEQISAAELLKAMSNADAELQSAVQSVRSDAEINWPGEDSKSVASHLCNLILHESFHVGQLVAFFYAVNVPIPPFVVEMWALSPQPDKP